MRSALSTSQLFVSANAAATPEATQALPEAPDAPRQPFSKFMDQAASASSMSFAPGQVHVPKALADHEIVDAAKTQDFPRPSDQDVPSNLHLAESLTVSPPFASTSLNVFPSAPSAHETEGQLADVGSENTEQANAESISILSIESHAIDRFPSDPTSRSISEVNDQEPSLASRRIRDDKLQQNEGQQNTSPADPNLLSKSNFESPTATSSVNALAFDLPSSDSSPLARTDPDATKKTSQESHSQNTAGNSLPSADANRQDPNGQTVNRVEQPTDTNSQSTALEPSVSIVGDSIESNQIQSDDADTKLTAVDDSILPTQVERQIRERTSSALRHDQSTPNAAAIHSASKQASGTKDEPTQQGLVPSTENSEGDSAESPSARVTDRPISEQPNAPGKNGSSAFNQSNDVASTEKLPEQPQSGGPLKTEQFGSSEVSSMENLSHEPSAASHNIASDRDTTAQAAILQANDTSTASSRSAASSTIDANSLVNAPANSAARSVTQQAAAAVAHVIESIDGKSKTMSFNLEPADLGKLTIQITQSSEAIAAQIIASELASSDLISAQKESLQDALSELGFDDASVDVSHGGHASQDREEKSPQQKSAHTFSFPQNQMGPSLNSTTSRSGLDIVA